MDTDMKLIIFTTYFFRRLITEQFSENESLLFNISHWKASWLCKNLVQILLPMWRGGYAFFMLYFMY